MITWITEKVAIGEYLDAINKETIKQNKIDCVLNLSMSPDVRIRLSDKIAYFVFPIGRHEGLEAIIIEVKAAAYLLKLLTEKYKKILVHCIAGIDRSPAVVAKYLSDEKYGFILGTDEAYEYVKNKRPQIKKHWEWIK